MERVVAAAFEATAWMIVVSAIVAAMVVPPAVALWLLRNSSGRTTAIAMAPVLVAILWLYGFVVALATGAVRP